MLDSPIKTTPMSGRSEFTTRQAFALRLRQLRKDAGLTAREMAERLGEKENTYTRWERGEVEPGLGQALRICFVLGISPNRLLNGLPFTVPPK
jgi:transcriptional regulator with XRE-family HTH domain